MSNVYNAWLWVHERMFSPTLTLSLYMDARDMSLDGAFILLKFSGMCYDATRHAPKRFPPHPKKYATAQKVIKFNVLFGFNKFFPYILALSYCACGFAFMARAGGAAVLCQQHKFNAEKGKSIFTQQYIRILMLWCAAFSFSALWFVY